ncbi:MAG: asparagine synthase (glutamine-hydrolyzing) [Candidatus Hodarchaeota archaeon]
MSGICGFNFDNKHFLKKMCDLIKHRGPDGAQYFCDSDISIGRRIFNFKKNHSLEQLVHNENENIWVISDGEIFNYGEIKEKLEEIGHIFYTDDNSEVIIHAYEEWGENCVNNFRGVFSFCIYDSTKKHLFIARDHIGIKTLYYYFDGNVFIFGSEIKSILCYDIKREVNKRVLGQYIALDYVPLDMTLFKGIKKVPSSSYLIFDLKNKKLNIKRYWDFNFSIIKGKNETQLAKELKNLIISSIKVRLVDDIPIGAFLSGGLDSSTVVAVLSNLLEKPVKTFSISFEEGAPTKETNYSNFVADYYSTDHKELLIKSDFYDDFPKIIWHNDDLIADAAIIPVYLMGRQVKKNLNFVFTGDGGDEVFGGYLRDYNYQKYDFLKYTPQKVFDVGLKYYNHIPIQFFRSCLSYFNQSKTLRDRYIRELFYTYDEELSLALPYEIESVSLMIKNLVKDKSDAINQIMYWDLKYQLPSRYNVKADRALSAASLAGRIPLLDRDIVAWSLTIPSKLKLKGKIEKYILRLAMKDILPPEILKRKKVGFGTPINFWLITGLKDTSKAILERLEQRNDLFKPKYVKMVKRKRLNKRFETKVWNLIMFELWYETYFENDGLRPIKL